MQKLDRIILANLAKNSTRKYQKCGRWLSLLKPAGIDQRSQRSPSWSLGVQVRACRLY